MKKTIVLKIVCMALLFTSCSKDSNEMGEANSGEATIYIVGSNGREDSGLVPLQALLC